MFLGDKKQKIGGIGETPVTYYQKQNPPGLVVSLKSRLRSFFKKPNLK